MELAQGVPPVLQAEQNPFPFHEVVAWFPGMATEQYQELREDIRSHGIRQSVVVYRGEIIDGYHRIKAAQQTGQIIPFHHLEEDSDPIAWAVSANVHRRHMDEGALALIAGRIADAPSGRPKANGEKRKSIGEAAKDTGVSERSAYRGKKVLREGTGQVQDAVRDGVVSLRDAEAATVADETAQNQAVNDVRNGKSTTLVESLRRNGDLFEGGSSGGKEGAAGGNGSTPKAGRKGANGAAPEASDAAPAWEGEEVETDPSSQVAVDAGTAPAGGGRKDGTGKRTARPIDESHASRIRGTLGTIEVELGGDAASHRVSLSEEWFTGQEEERHCTGRVWLRPGKGTPEHDDRMIGEVLEGVRTGATLAAVVEVDACRIGSSAVQGLMGHAIALALPAGDAAEEIGSTIAVLLGKDAQVGRMVQAWGAEGTVWSPAQAG